MFHFAVIGLVTTAGLLLFVQSFGGLSRFALGLISLGLNVALFWLTPTLPDALVLQTRLTGALISPIALTIFAQWSRVFWH